MTYPQALALVKRRQREPAEERRPAPAGGVQALAAVHVNVAPPERDVDRPSFLLGATTAALVGGAVYVVHVVVRR